MDPERCVRRLSGWDPVKLGRSRWPIVQRVGRNKMAGIAQPASPSRTSVIGRLAPGHGPTVSPTQSTEMSGPEIAVPHRCYNSAVSTRRGFWRLGWQRAAQPPREKAARVARSGERDSPVCWVMEDLDAPWLESRITLQFRETVLVRDGTLASVCDHSKEILIILVHTTRTPNPLRT
jgi:hypothetical protein